jgi:hypothetical protein
LIEEPNVPVPAPVVLEAQESAAELETIIETKAEAEAAIAAALGNGPLSPPEAEELARASERDLPRMAFSLAFWRLVKNGDVELDADGFAYLAQHQGNGHGPS